jgi:hypothetical protein
MTPKTFTICLFVLLLGTTIQIHAQNNNAISLSGTSYIDAGSNAALAATNIRTMECWVKFNSISGTQEILSRSTNSVGIEMLLIGGNFAFFCMNSPTNASSVTYSISPVAGAWYHLAVSWDGATKESMSIYINGTKVSATLGNVGNINSTGIANPTGTFRIGEWSDAALGRNLNGVVDEARIWSTTRTAAQIKSGMNGIVPTTSTGLIAYYTFNQASGDVINTTGNTALNGTLTGSPAFVASPIQFPANALAFDGVDDQVVAPPNSAYDLTTGTVEFWAMPRALSASTQQALVSVRSSGACRYSFHITNAQLGFWNGVTYVTLAHPFSNNTWYHFAFVLGAGSTQVYINGVAAGSFPEGVGSATLQQLHMGGTPDTEEFFPGSLDEVRIWNTQRTASQISSNMEVTLTGSESGLVGLFSFDQGNSGNDNSGLILALDNTTNNNYATLDNFTLSGSTSNFTLSSIPTLPVLFTGFTGTVIKAAGVAATSGATGATAGASGSAGTPAATGASVLLNWQTAQEQNSSVFVVEHCTDNRSFTEIGRVAAAGNSQLPLDYSFTDNNPSAGTNYYRIHEVDLDGKFMYSSVVVLNISASQSGQSGIRIYPNPAQQTLNYVVTSGVNTNGQVQISDLSGRLITSRTIQLTSGVNYLSQEIGHLIPGAYVLRVIPQSGAPSLSQFQVIK